jgi:hypothetical protein
MDAVQQSTDAAQRPTNEERTDVAPEARATVGGDRETRMITIVVTLASLLAAQTMVWMTGAVVGLLLVTGAIVGGSPPVRHVEQVAPADERPDAPEAPTEPRAERDAGPDGPDGSDDPDGGHDVWTLDGFADFGDVRMTVAGHPGEDWSETHWSGRTVWTDARCRVTAEVMDVDGSGDSGEERSDAAASERLARSLGSVALGGVETRSDPEPATVRLPLPDGRRAVELASVALLPVDADPDGASFVAVSARVSVRDARAVVVALACIDTSIERADPLARELVSRFRLETVD